MTGELGTVRVQVPLDHRGSSLLARKLVFAAVPFCVGSLFFAVDGLASDQLRMCCKGNEVHAAKHNGVVVLQHFAPGIGNHVCGCITKIDPCVVMLSVVSM